LLVVVVAQVLVEEPLVVVVVEQVEFYTILPQFFLQEL
jgi:hypothetical protein